MKDQHLRTIDYARISITDACNLNCHYCKNGEDLEVNRLTTKQLKVMIDALDQLSFKKVKFTGGEPLLNPDIVEIVRYANNKENIKNIGLTTNGIQLDQFLDGLIQAGLKRVNVSLDSLKRDKFLAITKSDALNKVLANVILAKKKGLIVKVNVVLMKGINDNEIQDFLEFGRINDVQFRFIELMPIGHNQDYFNGKQLNATELFKNYERKDKKPNCKDVSDYYIDEFGYVFGIISPLSNHFCKACNRIRFTSDGKLKLCLHSNQEINIQPYLNDPDELAQVILKNINQKPNQHRLKDNEISNRAMNKVGG